MTSALGAGQGLNGASIDGGWYIDVAHFAQDTPWLQGFMVAYTNYGIVLFALLLLAGWWTARNGSSVRMAAALSGPVAMVFAYVVNSELKQLVQEPRPCRAIPSVPTVLPCDPANDYAFPSNHSTVVGAVVVVLLFVHRRLAAVAAVAALVMGVSRVYVGAHYPHDVLAGLASGALVALVTTLIFTRFLPPVVTHLRDSRLRPLLMANSAQQHETVPEFSGNPTSDQVS